MPLIKPFRGLRPQAKFAADVLAPPYDVLNTDEARQQASGREYSFLHISRPEIDLPEGTDPCDPAVYRKGAENLQALVNDEILIRDPGDYYYAYQLVMGNHQQVGLVAIARVADYDTNRIRKHEFTRPDKEDDRVRQIDTLNAQTGPVFLTYQHNDFIDKLMDEVIQQTPEYDLCAGDGVQHRLWLIRDQSMINNITSTFDAMDCLYIADGHHRSAAASRVAALRNQQNPLSSGEESYDYFLAVIFPDNQMQILDYNRLIRDLNQLDIEDFFSQLTDSFNIEKSESAVSPDNRGQFGMYLDGQWYRLSILQDKLVSDPVGQLDVSLLHDNLIRPILGISDPRRDKRIDFVGGIRGLSELEKRVDSGEMRVAFSFHPTSLADLMAVADAHEVMPPKSTWFEPKLADGLVSHVLD